MKIPKVMEETGIKLVRNDKGDYEIAELNANFRNLFEMGFVIFDLLKLMHEEQNPDSPKMKLARYVRECTHMIGDDMYGEEAKESKNIQ